MVSVWGSNRNEQRTTEEGERYPEQQYEHQEPDERTRLIPRGAPNEGYLSPDDPAVSITTTNLYAHSLTKSL